MFFRPALPGLLALLLGCGAAAHAAETPRFWDQFFANSSKEVVLATSVYRATRKSRAEWDIEDRLVGMIGGLKFRTTAVVGENDDMKFDFILATSSTSSDYSGFHDRLGGDNIRSIPHFAVREAFWRRSGSQSELLIGKSLLKLGKSTLYSPMNTVNVPAGVDPVFAEELGVWNVSLERFTSKGGIRFSFLPFHESAKIPGERSRWQGDAVDAQFAFVELPEEIAVPVVMDENPARTLRNAGFLARFAATDESLDYVFSLHHGFSPYPVLEGGGDTLNPVFSKAAVKALTLGAGAAMTKGPWEWHGEAAWQVSENRRDQDFVRYVGGFTWRETTRAPRLGLQEISPTVEYAGEHVTSARVNPGSGFDSKNARANRNTVLSRIEFIKSDRLKFLLGGVLNLGEADASASVGFEYAPSDNMKINTGLQFFEGSRGSFFGRWDGNDRLVIRVNYSL